MFLDIQKNLILAKKFQNFPFQISSKSFHIKKNWGKKFKSFDNTLIYLPQQQFSY